MSCVAVMDADFRILEVVSKPQIRLKDKAQDAGGVMCNI